MERLISQMAHLFLPGETSLNIEPWGKGHINATYRVVSNSSGSYILQCLNNEVFQDPEALMHNYRLLLDHYKSKRNIKLPRFYKSVNNRCLEYDSARRPWRFLEFIEGAYSLDFVTAETQAYEAGLGYGAFLAGCEHCRAKEFTGVIPDFHNLKIRMKQMNQALNSDPDNRRTSVTGLVQFYKDQYRLIEPLISDIDSGELPVRIVHNDTKINNLMYKNGRVRAVVDLDTTGPGSVLFDFGDAIRTIANDSAEDEQNTNSVGFNKDFFRAFTAGYLQETRNILTEKEILYLWQSPIYMALIMGVRFLSDYINGDIYYKTNYQEHNLVRSRVQSKLLESMQEHSAYMSSTIKQYLSTNI